MLKNKLVEQILAERFYIIEKATDDVPPPPSNQESSSVSTDMLMAALAAIAAGGGAVGVLNDLKKLLSPPNPVKTDPDVLISKIPSMLRPETLRNPKLQRVKEFGSAEGKKIAS
jgi:hypothetical protein